jgi:hypothetical protein
MILDIEKFNLERSLPTPCAKAFEKLLIEANESYHIVWKKTKHVKIDKYQYWNFEVNCPERNFPDAYAHIGLLWHSYVLPEWQKYLTRNRYPF